MGDKIVSKSEQMQKEPLDEKRRDRGDNLKKQDVIKNKPNEIANTKIARKSLSNQGDVPAKVTKIPKPVNNINKTDKLTDIGKKQSEIKSKVTNEVPKVTTGAEKSTNKTFETNAAVKKVGDRAVSDKLTRAKTFNNLNLAKDIKNAKADVKPEPALKEVSDPNKPDSTKIDTDGTKKEKETTRRAMIKTVKSKNDNRVYKAVTFTEQRRVKPTLLEINIPNTQAKKKTKLVDKNLEAKPASFQGTSNKSITKFNLKAAAQYSRRNRLTERTKRKKLNRCISSPDKFKKVDSPPTEVAKWAPSCLNAHTKPYYEAWVNTTLAAISKLSKKDKLFLEKQNIIKNFQKSLELGTESPDLIHENYTDEKYTGKIKIKQKNTHKNRRQPLITPLLDIDK